MPDLHPPLPDPAAPVRAGETVGASARGLDASCGGVAPGAYDHAGDLEHCPKSDDGSHCRCWWDDEGPCCRCGDDTGAGESDDSPRSALATRRRRPRGDRDISGSLKSRSGDGCTIVPGSDESALPGEKPTLTNPAESLSEPVPAFTRASCADLYNLGIPGFKPHDPYRQRTGEPGCECVRPVPTVREYGESFARAEQEEQACRVPHRLAFGELVLDLCCSCGADFPGGWCDLEAAIREALA